MCEEGRRQGWRDHSVSGRTPSEGGCAHRDNVRDSLRTRQQLQLVVHICGCRPMLCLPLWSGERQSTEGGLAENSMYLAGSRSAQNVFEQASLLFEVPRY